MIKLITFNEPKSPVSEAYRILRTNIQFSSIDEKVKTVVITSSGPAEGKSTTAANLAVVMAQNGSKTILIDCDQRRSKLHKLFNASNIVGLSNFLAGEASLDEAIKSTEVENLYIMPSGIKPPNPSELLSSARMKQFVQRLKENFDFIIFDTPPLLMVTDAQIVSKYADGCILVVSSHEANKEAAVKAKQLIENVNVKLLGVVLNKVDISRKGYYGYHYHYYYDSEGKKSKHKKRKIE